MVARRAAARPATSSTVAWRRGRSKRTSNWPRVTVLPSRTRMRSTTPPLGGACMTWLREVVITCAGARVISSTIAQRVQTTKAMTAPIDSQSST